MRKSLARPAIAMASGSVLALVMWLLGTAMPVLADGGIHIAGINSGTSTLTSDTCSRCHRAHSAQAAYLLVEDQIPLCLSCHGTTGSGATVNVEDGLQYDSLNLGSGGAVAGALRSGGFVNAAIDSGHSSRISYPYWMSGVGYVTSFSSKVGVLTTPQAVTSAHMDLDGTGRVVARNKAWGNGAIGSGAGPVVSMECTSCHNPHGNGQYRILNLIPAPAGSSFIPDATPNPVTDAALPSGSGTAATRNYTVKWGRTLADVTGLPTDGDYWRKFQPWNIVPVLDAGGFDTLPPGGSQGDTPMFVSGGQNLSRYGAQISGWCSACHTRYQAGTSAVRVSSGDPIFNFRHNTTMTACTQCHVAHGSNAVMGGTFSGPMKYPDGTDPNSVTSGPVTTYLNSRLLKIDNRGTCEACHDPTRTIPYDGTIISH